MNRSKLNIIPTKIIISLKEAYLTFNIPKAIREIRTVLNEEPLWKGMPRKNYKKRLVENIAWYIKNKEVCEFYNSYGFDIIGFRNQSDYLPYRKFRIERNMEDLPSKIYLSKLCVLRDKVIFAAFFGSLLGENYIVPTLATIDENASVYDHKLYSYVNAKEYFQKCSKTLFAKKIYGECGDGVYIITHHTNINELLKEMKGAKYIIQEKLEQHDDIAKINPSCINTIRIITIIGKKQKNLAFLLILCELVVIQLWIIELLEV
ncbi:sugar-transfer associated ATP-grasp domain-containing protein [Ruminococcus sp.]|uniref:sugar-transfer associated ATP-grasp domain-containing protein n=1 Tax=Ruminococcus sp. TaxID=41978 RepID=UPI0025DAE55E|nr:sugar-transfer associated ATP-grasp domain-containing protein [Ruminococcus sp.]